MFPFSLDGLWFDDEGLRRRGSSGLPATLAASAALDSLWWGATHLFAFWWAAAGQAETSGGFPSFWLLYLLQGLQPRGGRTAGVWGATHIYASSGYADLES